MASRGRGRGVLKLKPVSTPLSSNTPSSVNPVSPLHPEPFVNPTSGLARSSGVVNSNSVVVPTAASKGSPFKMNPFDIPFAHLRENNLMKMIFPPEVAQQITPTRDDHTIPNKSLTNKTGNMTKSSPSHTGTKPTAFEETTHGINENDEILCVTGAICNPSDFYLARAPDCMQRINNMSEKLTAFYNVASRVCVRYRYVPRRSDIIPGLMVAVCVSQNDDKKWFRGRILSNAAVDPKCPRVLKYNVERVDNGGQIVVLEENIFHLDEWFQNDPQVPLKCRIALCSDFDIYHRGEKKWPQQIASQMVSVLHGKQFFVKFHRRIFHRGVYVWEVTPLCYKDEMGPLSMDYSISH